MQDAAVISGSLVDAKNVNTHKVMRLIIDVPAENALKVIAAFGWPTMVNPVSVAVARLDERKVLPTEQPNNHRPDPTPRPDQSVGVPAGADKERRAFSELKPPQQAGILCNSEAFYRFLAEKFGGQWSQAFIATRNNFGEDFTDGMVAAECVRRLCKVRSRADIKPNNTEWLSLVLAYRLWQNHPELEDA